MSAFDTAMRRIMTTPREVLKQAFSPVRYDPTYNKRFYDNQIPLSLESVITDKIIIGRVMPDINLVSGTEVTIPLSQSEMETVDLYNTLFRFNESATQGRTITSVLEVTYGNSNNMVAGSIGQQTGYVGRSSSLLQASRDVLRGAAGSFPTSTSYVQLVGHNTILVNDRAPMSRHAFLRCHVTNDPNLNNLRTQYHQDFANLCMLAVRSFVYTALVIELDEGMLRGGQQIGRFREIVDSYADAESMYIEELKRWQKIGVLNDPTKARRVNKLALGIRVKS